MKRVHLDQNELLADFLKESIELHAHQESPGRDPRPSSHSQRIPWPLDLLSKHSRDGQRIPHQSDGSYTGNIDIPTRLWGWPHDLVAFVRVPQHRPQPRLHRHSCPFRAHSAAYSAGNECRDSHHPSILQWCLWITSSSNRRRQPYRRLPSSPKVLLDCRMGTQYMGSSHDRTSCRRTGCSEVGMEMDPL